MGMQRITEKDTTCTLDDVSTVLVTKKVENEDGSTMEALRRIPLPVFLAELLDARQDNPLEGTTEPVTYQSVGDFMRDLSQRLGNLDVSIDPDDLGLEQDPDTGYVYLTYRGERSENGIPLAASGGGGSGGLTYAVTLRNNLDTRALTVAEGAAAVLEIYYSSVDEEGYGDGDGIGTITVDNVKVATVNVPQGDSPIDVAEYLTPGEHTVKLKVTNSEGLGKMLTYTVTVVSLQMTTTMDAMAIYSGDVTSTIRLSVWVRKPSITF